MTSIYCGNNRLHKRLLNSSAVIGERYSCLKKGVGVGLNLPFDREYAEAYEPIDNTRIYCGTKMRLPEGYHRFGENHECHRIGVGIGKSQKAKANSKRRKRKSQKLRRRKSYTRKTKKRNK